MDGDTKAFTVNLVGSLAVMWALYEFFVFVTGLSPQPSLRNILIVGVFAIVMNHVWDATVGCHVEQYFA